MNWNGYFGYYCDEGVRRAYKDKVGNVAEINLMLTAMLRYAGLDANPVLVSTRSHGIPLFPTREGFNYVISAVSMDEGYVLLDGTAKFSVPGMLPPRAHNWNGRLIKKEGASEEISLTPRAMSKEMISVTYKLTKTVLPKERSANNLPIIMHCLSDRNILRSMRNSISRISKTNTAAWRSPNIPYRTRRIFPSPL